MRRFAVTIVALWVLLAGFAMPAAAEETAPDYKNWYGWQIWLADAAIVACGVYTESGYCAVPYLLSGPIVHAAHRRPGKGVFSLGLRVALPLVAGYVGAMTAECPQNTWDWDCSFSAMGKGMLVGAGIAVIADGILALTADIPISRDPEPPPARRGAVAPSFSVGAGNVGLGLRGTF